MIKRLAVLLSLLAFGSLGFASDSSTRVPTVDDLLTIKSVGGTQISPDGKWVAYTVSYGDFKQDAFITHISAWVHFPGHRMAPALCSAPQSIPI